MIYRASAFIIYTEIFNIGNKDIRGCIACGRCGELGHCVFDDAVNEFAAKFEKADGLVVGSPVYYSAPNATVQAFLQRLFYSSRFDKTMKVGAGFVCARRGGTTASFDVLNKFFTISGMPIASSQYWNNIHGGAPEEARKVRTSRKRRTRLDKLYLILIKFYLIQIIFFGLQSGFLRPSVFSLRADGIFRKELPVHELVNLFYHARQESSFH